MSAKLLVLLLALAFIIAFSAFTAIKNITPPEVAGQSNPYANPHSQAVADWVVNNMYNSQVNMLATDPSPGCVDTLGGVTVACADAFWTTSDNLPTCATLIDFGYQSISDACINKILGCNSSFVPSEWQTSSCPKNPLKFEFTSNSVPASEQGTWLSGWRYESFFAIPIPLGSPGDQHFVVMNGTLSNGTPYAIKADIATLSVGSQDFGGPVDVVAPQCVDEYLRGNLSAATTCANELISSWDGNGVGGGAPYSTWQLGQAMFVMRVLKLDQNSSSISTNNGTMSYSTLFNAMESKLWAVQAAYQCPVGSSGCLPNSYNAANQGSGGTDAENQDAGLLPFSSSVISLIQNSFGECKATSAPPGGANSTSCDDAALGDPTTTMTSASRTTVSTTLANSSESTIVSTSLTTASLTHTNSTSSVTFSNSSATFSENATAAATTRSNSSIAFSNQTTLAGFSSPIRSSLDPSKVQSSAIAMGTGSGAIVFLGGLFPMSHFYNNASKQSAKESPIQSAHRRKRTSSSSKVKRRYSTRTVRKRSTQLRLKPMIRMGRAIR